MEWYVTVWWRKVDKISFDDGGETAATWRLSASYLERLTTTKKNMSITEAMFRDAVFPDI